MMKAKQNEFDKVLSGEYAEDAILFEKVKWTEDGITHLGTVREIRSEKGIKYLTVMTIFGKRCKVKMSKVRLISEHLIV